jgi:hypothetical protein
LFKAQPFGLFSGLKAKVKGDEKIEMPKRHRKFVKGYKNKLVEYSPIQS